jgi:putative NADPH-quinone reductase
MRQPTRLLIINAHPALARKSLCGSLAKTYATAAKHAGYKVDLVHLSQLKFDPILHEGLNPQQPLEPDLIKLRHALEAADHWVIVFPLWLALPPALLKGALERVVTHGYAFTYKGKYPVATDVFKGKSVSMIITCGMPGWLYHWFSGAHASRALGTTFKLCGLKIAHVRAFGPIVHQTDENHTRYASIIQRVEAFGRRGW